jgi:DNA mismatch repair ATPase MutL
MLGSICLTKFDIDNYDVNVSPDKRTIFLFSENSFLQALKVRLLEIHSERD